MMVKLLIVESFEKSKRIAGYIGAGWKVEASLGHVCDLPEATLGVDVENGFRLEYEASPKQRQIMGKLLKAIGAADEIYMAMDPDREGEAIAHHILVFAKDKIKNKPVYRVTFTAITKSAVLA